MSTLKAIQTDPNITFSGAADPTQSETGAKVDDLYHQTTSGELFRCTVETLGSQEWAGSQGNTVGVLDPILATDHPNLVAMYTMDNISGSTLNDESPNSVNGTLINSPTFAAGKIGNAVDLLATSSQYVDLGTTGLVNATDPKTVCGWVNLDSTSLRTYVYAVRSDSGGAKGFYLGSVGTTIYADFFTGGILAFSGQMSAGSQIFLALTHDGTGGTDKVKVYKDGVLLTPDVNNSLAPTNADAGSSRLLGSQSNVYMSGLLDQVRVFDRVLTQSEITTLAGET